MLRQNIKEVKKAFLNGKFKSEEYDNDDIGDELVQRNLNQDEQEYSKKNEGKI